MSLRDQPAYTVDKPKHKRGKPKRVNRGRFSKYVREQIKDHFNNQCQECGRKGVHIHHVMPKGSGIGRGIFTNGLLVCNPCHQQIHADPERLMYWKRVFKELHGPNYYKDQKDLEDERAQQHLKEMDEMIEGWINEYEAE